MEKSVNGGMVPTDSQFAKPIVVSVDAQELGMLAAMHTSPYGYQQYILAKLKESGAPVEGVLDLRLAHGKLARVKNSIMGKGQFDYMWVPDYFWEAMQQAAQDEGFLGVKGQN
jgi:hypothetical protein